MRIAMVFDGLGFGGIERVGCDYAHLLTGLGHQVDIYNLVPSKNEMETLFPEECALYKVPLPRVIVPERYGVVSSKVRGGIFLFPIIYPVLSLVCAGRKLLLGRRRRYDLAIAFSGHYNDLTFVADNFVLARYKLCWLHGCLIDYLSLSDSFFRLYRKIKNLCVLSDQLQQSVVSENRALQALQIFKLYNPCRMFGADPASNTEITQKYGKFILSVARMEPPKDPRTILDAYLRMRKELPNAPALLFIGEGSLLQPLKEDALRSEYANDIFFLGGTSNVRPYLQAAKLFVHSSAYEGLPTVLIEAMTAGVPIVATNSEPGVGEVLDHGACGAVCDVGDPVGMAEKMKTLILEPEIAQSYAARGRERARLFAPETIQKQLQKMLDLLIE